VRSSSRKTIILKTFIAHKKNKSPTFQVLLLDNDSNDDVAVTESEEVNFGQVKEHLKNGGSVFITSKNTQKINYHGTKAQQNLCKSRQNTGLLFLQHMRHS
jgi:hypothetical protein